MLPEPLNVTSPQKLFAPLRVIELADPFAKSVVWLIASAGVIVPFAPSVNSSFAKEVPQPPALVELTTVESLKVP